MNLKALTLALFLSNTEALGLKTKLKSMSKKSTDPECYFAEDRIANDRQQFINKKKKSGRQLDKDFPPDWSSLFFDNQDGDYEADMRNKVTKWKRPNKIANKIFGKPPSLYGDQGIQPHGVQQGALGDSWFLAAAAAVAEYPDLITKDILKGNGDADQKWPEQGVFRVHFYVRGQRATVLVDDKLPVTDGLELVNARPSDQNAWWFVIMEKAYAKLNLNYATLNGGYGAEALRALTGAPVQSIRTQDYGKKEVYKMIKKADEEGSIMTAACSVAGNGLITGHHYTVLGAHTFKDGKKLINLRNPWGSEEYNGRWSEDGEAFTQELQDEVGHVGANDGRFWVSVGTFHTQFHTLDIASPKLSKEKYTMRQRGVAGQQFWLKGSNPSEQSVTIGVDAGTSRMQGPGCQPDYFMYNFYVLPGNYPEDSNMLAGPIAVSNELGYSQVTVDLPAGDFQLLVTNWGDASAEADFGVQTYGATDKVSIGLDHIQ